MEFHTRLLALSLIVLQYLAHELEVRDGLGVWDVQVGYVAQRLTQYLYVYLLIV